MNRLIVVAFFVSSFFACKQKSKLTRKDLPFEKIIFHTSMCFGSCPVYHLEVDSDRMVKLFAETVYKNTDEGWHPDTSKTGYFTGMLSDSTSDKLSNAIKLIGMDTIKFNNETC